MRGLSDEIPGVGVSAHELRSLAEMVVAALGVNGTSVEKILEHSICQAITQLDDVADVLEKKNQYGEATAVRRIKCALECAQESAETLHTLLTIDAAVRS